MTTIELNKRETIESASLVVDSFQALETHFTNAEEYALLLERTAEALATENRWLGHQIANLTFENRRLHRAAEQMRAELLVLNKLLEPLHAVVEEKDRQHRPHEQQPAGSNNEPVTERHNHEEELAGLSNQLLAARARLASAYSSRSWRLTAPLRWCDAIQRRAVRGIRKAFRNEIGF